MVSFPFERIVVIGSTGSGKSTLAERLACILGADYIELDAIFWKPDWVESEDEEFRTKVEVATHTPAWVLAGNYSKVRDIIWPRAQAVIWLDYPFPLVLGQLWNRTWQRWRSKELIWGTNYERLFPQFKIWSKDSLFFWLAVSYPRHRRDYPRLFIRPEYSHLKVFRFRHPREIEIFMEALAPQSA